MSKVVWYGTRQRLNNTPLLTVTSGGNQLPVDSQYRYLGVILDQQMTLEKCVKDIIKKTSCRIYSFNKIRYLLDLNTSILVYKQTIAPLFDYCSFLLDGASVQEMSRLQHMQNRKGSVPRGHRITELHKECKVPLLADHRREQLA